MPPDREAILRDAIAALNRGDLSVVPGLFHPDIEWKSPEEWLERDVYRGHDGVREIGNLWLQNFDDYRWKVVRAEFAGDIAVLLVNQRGRTKEHGVPVEQPIGVVFEWSGDRIVRAATYNDWDEALAAAGAG